ncbi:MAG TPA: uroporphyrinogen decarboxylase family protein [Oscillospiraceae bacterium]|nr:uroporphyrinogen decarboxylase family protein [Oscillospiraceae bacterium]
MINPEAKKLAQERDARMKAAIALKEPDWVPFMGLGGDVVAAYAGFTSYEFNFDYEKAHQATIKYLKDFPSDRAMAGMSSLGNLVMTLGFLDFPDLANSFFMVNGPMNDILKVKYCRFPGRELPENSSPQFIGGTYMQPEEYDELIADPVKFSYEKILPRTITTLQELGSPTALAAMARFGLEIAKQRAAMMRLAQDLAALGYASSSFGAFACAPLDYIGDQLRDIPNLILDLRRYPDKIKAATRSLLETLLSLTLQSKAIGADSAMFPLHLNEYLSPELYKEFYWPTLKEYVLRLREEGIRSQIFFEGRHDAHLDTILELPAGWGSAYFEKTDVRKAKKLLQGHTCIMGGIDVGVVISSTPAKIDEYIKELLGDMMPGGGFILCANVNNLPRETPVENIRAVYEAVEKYGKY